MKKCKLCFNCLTEGHSSKECTKYLSCKDCGRKHSNLLHFRKSADSSKITDKKISTSFVNGSVGKVVSAFPSGSQSQKCSMILPVYISHRCTKKYFRFRRYTIIHKTHNILDRNTLRNLYFTFIYPYLIYCIEIWGNSNDSHLNPIIKIQKKGIRAISFAHYLDPTSPLFRRLNILNF